MGGGLEQIQSGDIGLNDDTLPFGKPFPVISTVAGGILAPPRYPRPHYFSVLW